MFGVVPVVLDEEGKELTGACEGFLAIKNSWPGQVRFKVQILCFSLLTTSLDAHCVRRPRAFRANVLLPL